MKNEGDVYYFKYMVMIRACNWRCSMWLKWMTLRIMF